jgi:hypothetical protein
MNLSKIDYDEIRGMLLDVMEDMPRLCCEDFHHNKRDQHKDNYCPVETRFYSRLNKLLLTFGIQEIE